MLKKVLIVLLILIVIGGIYMTFSPLQEEEKTENTQEKTEDVLEGYTMNTKDLQYENFEEGFKKNKRRVNNSRGMLDVKRDMKKLEKKIDGINASQIESNINNNLDKKLGSYVSNKELEKTINNHQMHVKENEENISIIKNELDKNKLQDKVKKLDSLNMIKLKGKAEEDGYSKYN